MADHCRLSWVPLGISIDFIKGALIKQGSTGHVSSLLRQQGISCHLRNENLVGALGELPPTECWPEVWIADDGDQERAQEIINAALAPLASQPGWHCRCGEDLEGQFSHCWRCGADRESVTEANV